MTALYVTEIYIDGSTKWHTDRGLHIGDSVSRVGALYPGAHTTHDNPYCYYFGRVQTKLETDPALKICLTDDLKRVEGFVLTILGAAR